jgi:ribonuclease D
MMLNEIITPEEIDCLEIISFPGEISVISTIGKKYTEAIKHLREQIFIGFDTETKPNFQANTPRHSTALLQLSSETKAYLFRVQKIGIPQELAELLSNPEITKVGAATTDDIRGLQCYTKFEPQRFIDLQDFVEQYGILEKSVRKLAAIILGKRISKAQQLSNWESAKLTPAQQLYAATDAWICVKMYKKLLSCPKAPLKENGI